MFWPLRGKMQESFRRILQWNECFETKQKLIFQHCQDSRKFWISPQVGSPIKFQIDSILSLDVVCCWNEIHYSGQTSMRRSLYGVTLKHYLSQSTAIRIGHAISMESVGRLSSDIFFGNGWIIDDTPCRSRRPCMNCECHNNVKSGWHV